VIESSVGNSQKKSPQKQSKEQEFPFSFGYSQIEFPQTAASASGYEKDPERASLGNRTGNTIIIMVAMIRVTILIECRQDFLVRPIFIHPPLTKSFCPNGIAGKKRGKSLLFSPLAALLSLKGPEALRHAK
jgi:hypothetical protein